MSAIKLLTVTNAPEHAEVLRRSALHHNWDYHCEVVEWRGFGSKLIGVYNYLKEHPEVERFVFADAFDVVVMGTEEEFEEKAKLTMYKIVCSAEKGLWPPILEPYRSLYVTPYTDFKFVNSGCYYAPRERFMELIEKFQPEYETDDQFWFNIQFLFSQYGKPDFFYSMWLDGKQELFNSHSFIAEGEYTYNNGRVQIMGNEPVFVHKNGRTPDPKLDELVKNMLSL